MAAREVFESIFQQTPGVAQRGFIEFLAAAIEHLSVLYADRWGVTLFDWGLRLNVGWVECLILHAGGLRVLVEEESSPVGLQLDGRRYESAPGCLFATLPLSEIPQSLPFLADSHYAALSIAAKRPTTRNIKNAHSAGVTAFLSHVLRRPIPIPSYAFFAGDPILTMPEGETEVEFYSEGRRFSVTLKRFERHPAAREQCIAHYGTACSVCDMTFRERYGERMADFIHVHHIVPLSHIGTNHLVNPVTDLRPVCPNCHAVIHRDDPPLTIEQARTLRSL